MVRRMWSIAMVGLMLPLLGMGMLGGGGSGGLDRNYEGTFVDRDYRKVRHQSYSFDFVTDFAITDAEKPRKSA